MTKISGSTISKKNAVPVRERTYEYLKEKLLSGRFRPGERLTEEHLASEFGVSRTPVREALHKLEREGLVKPLETRGFCVPSDSKEEMAELFDIRSVLEGYALRCVCDFISEKGLSDLETCVQSAEKAFKQSMINRIYHLNTQFHDTLHDLVSDKPRLHIMIAELRKYVLRYRKDTLNTLEGAKRAIEGHRKIMLALRLKDPDLCERIMRDHIQASKEDAFHATLLDIESSGA
jgi:DNA-binding GntR family transcriptional regulator